MIKKILIILGIILLIVYSLFIEPNMLTVTNYYIEDSQLKGLRVVLVGDFHILPNQQKRLEKIVKLVNEQNADLVLSVGDFVAGNNSSMTMPIEDIVKGLENIKTKYGFYTVLGNHDCWIDEKGITDELNKNGIKVFTNSNTKLNINGKTLYLAGVEDMATRNPDVGKALEHTHNPVILLTHSPDIFPNVPQNVNITLAGHVHGGQVRLPLIGPLFVPSDYGDRYSQGYIKENDKKMIITKGIGNSTLQVRFNCVPEIVVINFK